MSHDALMKEITVRQSLGAIRQALQGRLFHRLGIGQAATLGALCALMATRVDDGRFRNAGARQEHQQEADGGSSSG
jgi:hypothetical protein